MMTKTISNPMINDHVKYFAKLFGRATLSFMKINLVGQLLIAILGVSTIVLLFYNLPDSLGGPGPSHANGITAIFFVFLLNPIGFGLTLITVFGFPYLLFSLGNKYVLSKSINQLITDKGETMLFPIIDKILNKVKQHSPELLTSGVDYTKLQLKILQELRDSKENKWLKKILAFGFKKVQLNEVDFKGENVSFTEIVKNKIIDKLKEVSMPNRNFFYIIIGVQTLLFLLVAFNII